MLFRSNPAANPSPAPNADTKASARGNADGPWGSTDAVKAVRATRAVSGSNVRGRKKTWAEMVDDEFEGEFEGRSVAGSTTSKKSWGNVSAGPWGVL